MKLYYLADRKLDRNVRLGIVEDGEYATATPGITHSLVLELDPTDAGDLVTPDDLFQAANGYDDSELGREIWEHVRETVAESDNLGHTSMSVGDVVELPDGRAFLCDRIGWKEITDSWQDNARVIFTSFVLTGSRPAAEA